VSASRPVDSHPPRSSNPAKALLAAVAYQGYNSCFTRMPFHFLRKFYLRRILGIRIGNGTFIGMGCFITGRNIAIGNNTVINRRCYLDGRAGLRIGDNVSVSPECYLLSLGHDAQSPDFNGVPGPSSLGDYVWLGARVMVLPGVDMGRGSVAGAGAVVTRSCGEFEILAGVPAKKIGERNRDLRYTLDYAPLFDTDVRL
jgi:acetyltransferase-like isoleucine patch superfamily enzyme